MACWCTIIFSSVALLAVLVYLYIKRSLSFWKRHGVPYASPGKINSLFKDALLGRIHIGEPFCEVYRLLEGESIGGYYKILKPTLMVRDPELVKAVLVQNFQSFHDNETNINEDIDPVGSSSPFFARGERWRMTRSQLTPAFSSVKIKSMFPLMLDVCQDLRTYLQQNKFPDGVEFKDLAARYTTDVVTSCALGLRANAIHDPNSIFRKMGEDIISPTFWTNIKFILQMAFPDVAYFLRIRIFPNHIADFFRGVLNKCLSERESGKVVRKDFLQLLLQLKQKGRITDDDHSSDTSKQQSQDTGYTDTDLISHTMTFFAEGFETSSIILSFMMFELALNPNVQENIRREINAALEESSGMITFDGVIKMKYLDLVFNETLRKHPVIACLIKECTKDCELHTDRGTIKVNKGMAITIPLFPFHRDPKYYPEPEKFDPERFNDENKDNIQRFTFLPFGEGPRACLGSRFAQAQIKAAVITLVRNFNVKVGTKTKLPIEYDPNYFMYMLKGGMWLHFDSIN